MQGIVVAQPEPGSARPESRIGGLSLAARAVASLERAGVQQIALVGPRALAERVAAERRRPVASGEGLAATIRGAALVVRHDPIVSPAILHQLLRRGAPGTAVMGSQRLGVSWVDRATIAAWEAGLPPVAVSGWWVPASEPKRALDQLLADCRKPADGLVSRHLNRRVSLFFTRHLVAHRAVTPNAMTGVMLGVSLAGALAAAQGGYRATLAGAALMQLGSILDGVDGEIARIRGEESALGAWLDTIADDLTNVAFWAGLARGADRPYARRSGSIAAVANALAALVNYGVLARVGRGDLHAIEGPPRRGLGRVLELALKQDTFLLLTLVLALVDRLQPALPLVAGGALVTLGAALHRAASRASSGTTPRAWCNP